nr:PREDICTED: uncharacterized protein LOC103559134 isoform X1 [Equus przewalskii]
MSLKPFTYPFPETRFLHAGPNVYKFKIRYGNSIRGEEIQDKEVIVQELEDSIRVVLGNLDNLQPFATEHFVVFPYKSRWERVAHLKFKHGEIVLVPYPFVFTLYVEMKWIHEDLSPGKPVNDCPLGLVLPERTAAGAMLRKRKRGQVPSSPGRPGLDRAKMGTSSQDSSKKKPPMETRRNRERKTQQEWQETPAFDITNVQDQALALGQLLDTREAESSRGGSLRTTPQRRARSPRWDCSRPLQGGRPESRSPRGRGSRMLANKNPESPHRLETSSRREDPLSKPSLGSWALEVMPMASPQTLLLWLLVLAVTEGQGRQVAIPGCHLHPFNVTVRSDRQGTCQGSHVAQACVGHCESSAFPSRYSVLVASGYRHNITSVSQCCTISSLSKVKVQLQCGGNRREELEIFTARACQCDMCRLSRY